MILLVKDNYFSSLIIIISTKAWYPWKLFFQVSENLIFFFLTSPYLPPPLHFSYALFSYSVAFFFSAPCQTSDLSPRRLRVQDDLFFKGKPYCYMSCGVVSIIRLKDGVKNDRWSAILVVFARMEPFWWNKALLAGRGRNAEAIFVKIRWCWSRS